MATRLCRLPGGRHSVHRHRLTFRLSLTLTAVLVLVLGGCGRNIAQTVVVRDRLIAEDPWQMFGPTTIVAPDEVLTLPFRSATDLDGWDLVGGRIAKISMRGATIESDQPSVTLKRPMNLPADSIDLVEVTVGGINRQEISFGWSRVGDPSCDDCRITLRVANDRRGGAATYVFQVSAHPEWKGTISEIRLQCEVPRSHWIVFYELLGIATRIDEHRLEDALGRPWKVDLDRQVRSCMLGLPGVPVRLDLEVPPRARLSFGYGVVGTATARVRFTVSVERQSGSSLQLFEQTPGAAAKWAEALIDIGAFKGERVSLVFATEVVEGEFDPLLEIPVWSSPEVLVSEPLQRPNVVLISIDTLRADRLSLYGYHRPTSPNLEAWVERRGATVFENAVAPAPWTLPSHVSMHTGLDALHHGVNYSSPAPPGLVTLAERLRDADYATVAFTGGGFVHPQWGFAQGFDQYGYFAVDMGFKDELEVNLEDASRWLRDHQERPFFMFFHTYEVHNPFRPRQPYFSQFSSYSPDHNVRIDNVAANPADGFLTRRSFSLRVPGQEETVSPVPPEFENLASDLYDSEIAYMDSLLSRLLELLDELNDARPNIVVITSDHGEMFGEHGVTNHTCLYEENLMVPLVIALPERVKEDRQRIDSQVRVIDIVPTILELVDLPPQAGVDGASLEPVLAGLATAVDVPAWSYSPATNYGLSLRWRNSLKYIFKDHPWPSPAEPKEELFRLDRDPDEAYNLVTGDPEVSLARSMSRHYLASRRGGVSARLFNKSDGVLVGRMRGGTVTPLTLKVSELIDDEFRWANDEAGFRIPPGVERVLWMEKPGAGALDFEMGIQHGDTQSSPMFSGTVNISSAGESVGIVFDGRQWAIERSDGAIVAATAGIQITRDTSPWGAAPSVEQTVDAAVHEQLRALGYAE